MENVRFYLYIHILEKIIQISKKYTQYPDELEKILIIQR